MDYSESAVLLLTPIFELVDKLLFFSFRYHEHRAPSKFCNVLFPFRPHLHVVCMADDSVRVDRTQSIDSNRKRIIKCWPQRHRLLFCRTINRESCDSPKINRIQLTEEKATMMTEHLLHLRIFEFPKKCQSLLSLLLCVAHTLNVTFLMPKCKCAFTMSTQELHNKRMNWNAVHFIRFVCGTQNNAESDKRLCCEWRKRERNVVKTK